LGEADSLQVEVMDNKGVWQTRWQVAASNAAVVNTSFAWPKGLRVTVKNKQQEKIWILPLLMGLP